MELPKRIDQHITETSSYKIFLNNIPDSWIVREISERDYGIDCYIELVNVDKQVTGELISIQLKGQKKIKWTKENSYKFPNVKISTTNYWSLFPTPVFICLVDLSTKEVFFSSVKSSIRENYDGYLGQKKLSYKFHRKNKLAEGEIRDFIMTYFKEKWYEDFEKQLYTFVSNLEHYKDYILEHKGRNSHMGVSSSRSIYLRHFYNNAKFLSDYLDIAWSLEPLQVIIKQSQAVHGDDFEIYEEQMEMVVTELEKLLLPILIKIRDIVTEKEINYWFKKDLHLYNVMFNVKDNGKMPIDWS